MTSELHRVVEKSRDLAPSSRARYLRDLNCFVEWAGADPAKWTQPLAQAFYDHLLDEKELRPQSANRLFASIAYASKQWAHAQQRPELDFAQIQRARKQGAPERRALDHTAVMRLLGSMEAGMLTADPTTMRDYALIVVMLETGMRKAAICSMTIERTIVTRARMEATGALYPYTWIRVKGVGDAAIPLSDTAVAALLPWITWLAKCGKTHGPIFRGISRELGDNGMLMHKIARGPLYPDYINRLLDARAAIAGIGRVFPQQLQRVFVASRVEAGMTQHEITSTTAVLDARWAAIAAKIRCATPGWLQGLVMR